MEVLVKTKELLKSLANVTESGSKIARYKIEVADLDRKLGLAFRRVGERAWRLAAESKTDVLGDPEVCTALDEVRRLRHRMEAIHREVERHTTKASTEFGKASKLVRDEAERTTGIVKREAGRAAAIIKEETVRAASAIKKAVSEKGTAGKKDAK